ncbi:MAG: glycoside hydrolase family 88 protein [Opitutales bacterium]|nr:glycoside hydrolase family 88 protein [Opitutales bacterium]
MKRIFAFIPALLPLFPQISYCAEEYDVVVRLNVTSRMPVMAEDYPVRVDVMDLGFTPDDPDIRRLTAWCEREGIPVPYQWVDTTRDGNPDILLLVERFDAGETREFTLREDPAGALAQAFPKRTQAELSIKVGGEWDGSKYRGGEFRNVREVDPPAHYTDHGEWVRYEGPGWESDRIGYRFYLDWRNGFDIFGKRTTAMVLQDVGQDGYQSYHTMADWGMDILRVGPAVGIGGYGMFADGRLERVSEVENRKALVAANGALYSAIDVFYEGWTVGNRRQDLDVRLGIHAGSHVTHVDMRGDPRRDLATGIVKLDGGELILGDQEVVEKEYTYIATYGEQSIIGDTLGMAVFYRPRDLRRLESDEHNHVVVLNPRGGTVHYAFTSVWEQEPGIDLTRDSFVEYLEKTALLLNRPALVFVESHRDRAQKAFPVSAEDALRWTTRMADSVLERRGTTLSHGNFDPESGAMARWRYTTGLLTQGFEELWRVTGDERYLAYMANTIGSFVRDDGTIHSYDLEEYNIDHVNPAKQLISLYEITGEERFRKALDLVRSQLDTHPRTSEGGFWHKDRYPWQMWLDGLYMGAPFYAQHAATFDEPEAFADIARQFELIERHAYDPGRRLLMHAWDERREQPWADDETGRSALPWGRALGWFVMALVDTLEYMPENSDEAATLKAFLDRTVAMILRTQDEDTGLWWQVLDLADRPGNYLEASASAMFVYALAKGVNHGWLGDTHAAAAVRGYEAMLRHFVRIHGDDTLSLDFICEVAGLSDERDGSFRYYMSEPVVKNDGKGMGPFLLAGIEMHRLLKAR